MRRLLFTAALALACAHGGGAPPNKGTRGILLECDPIGADVFVDDFYLDHALRWKERPMPLAAGAHRLELRADGYYPHYHEVEVPEVGFSRVAVRMRKIID